MEPLEYLKARQVYWARRRGIALTPQGSVHHLANNLFVPLSPPTLADLGVLQGQPPDDRLRAVHGGAAKTLNVFDYWRHTHSYQAIAAACGLVGPHLKVAEIAIEVQRPIPGIVGMAPNLDVELRFTTGDPARRGLLAIESKFCETYRQDAHGPFQNQYLAEQNGPLWEGLGPLHQLATELNLGQDPFVYLNAAQLIKHALGLRAAAGFDGFELLYLWTDAPGPQAVHHRAETVRFAGLAHASGVAFRSMTYQEMIFNLATTCRDAHSIYIDYLMERYF